MANGWGGARPGSGRKHGATDKRKASAELEARISEELVPHLGEKIAQMQPMHVMTLAMKMHMAEFDKTGSMDSLDKAVRYAEKAAPYVHPKLSNRQEEVTHNHTITSMPTRDIEALMAYHARRVNEPELLTVEVVRTEPRDDV